VLEGQKVLLLEENGYRILTATSGKEAVQAFVANSVDLACDLEAVDCFMTKFEPIISFLEKVDSFAEPAFSVPTSRRS
jgi:CheY-like chemotaxis protein